MMSQVQMVEIGNPVDGTLISVTPVACSIDGVWGSLRPLDAASDAAAIYRLSHDAETETTWREMKVGPFADESAFTCHVGQLARDDKRAFFAVTGRDGGPLGWMCLMEVRLPHNVVELGYVLFPPVLQRTALATEAFYLMLRHVFEKLKFRRLEWTCTASNVRSRKAADRLGFSYEGTFRHGLFLKGKPVDICMYSMLASEWRDNARALETWLRPENFVAGAQVRSLSSCRNDAA